MSIPDLKYHITLNKYHPRGLMFVQFNLIRISYLLYLFIFFFIANSSLAFANTSAMKSNFAEAKIIANFCSKVEKRFAKLGWDKFNCNALPLKVKGFSEMGEPLVYAELGFGKETQAENTETTLVLAGVHADELPCIYVAFNLLMKLATNPRLIEGKRVVLAPLVNPDSFFTIPAKRTNHNGVDLNRNFPTKDWNSLALKLWKNKRNSGANYFPGNKSNSEKGTTFQIELINHFDPDKIISMHSPLGFIDYDGPGEGKKINLTKNETKALQIAEEISKASKNYKLKDYPFYPGSLGNYAGNERAIPTITLEMPSSYYKKAPIYWSKFLTGIIAGIRYEYHRKVLAKKEAAMPVNQ